jgi:hypothetical protein
MSNSFNMTFEPEIFNVLLIVKLQINITLKIINQQTRCHTIEGTMYTAV